MLSSDAIRKGQAIQQHDSRPSFSNMAETVINKEYERIFPEAGNGKGSK